MRITRRSAATIVIATILATPLLATSARAAVPAPFSQADFAAAQKAGKPILVEITASWCPTCAKQRPILGALFAEPAYKDLVVYNVDFDTQKDVVREMGATMQSTLIAYHGTAEKARSTGVTDPAAIRTLVAKSSE